MAAKEMFDYFSGTLSADYTTAISWSSIPPSRMLPETGGKNQVVHEADDDSEEIISFSNDTIFFVTLQWNALTEANAGILFDLYHDSAKANGRERSFYWDHPTDGHSYTVRFASPVLTREVGIPSVHKITQIRFKILGVKP